MKKLLLTLALLSLSAFAFAGCETANDDSDDAAMEDDGAMVEPDDSDAMDSGDAMEEDGDAMTEDGAEDAS